MAYRTSPPASRFSADDSADVRLRNPESRGDGSLRLASRPALADVVHLGATEPRVVVTLARGRTTDAVRGLSQSESVRVKDVPTGVGPLQVLDGVVRLHAVQVVHIRSPGRRLSKEGTCDEPMYQVHTPFVVAREADAQVPGPVKRESLLSRISAPTARLNPAHPAVSADIVQTLVPNYGFPVAHGEAE